MAETDRRFPPDGHGAATRWLRTMGRILLFPVVMGIGVTIGIVAVLLNPRRVWRRLGEKRSDIVASFSPEERKVIRNILVGSGVLAAMVALSALAWHAWR